MLAYVFWHSRVASVSREQYETKLTRFHEALGRARLSGFLGSMVSRIQGAPWTEAGSEAYEDWYLLQGSAVIDRLNEVAVSGPRKQPHDEVAGLATAMRAGLFTRSRGGATPAAGGVATWFSKPAGMKYDDLYTTLKGRLTERVSLWRRQMVLAPTPEFCVLAPVDVSLPASFRGVAVRREEVWRSRSLSKAPRVT